MLAVVELETIVLCMIAKLDKAEPGNGVVVHVHQPETDRFCLSDFCQGIVQREGRDGDLLLIATERDGAGHYDLNLCRRSEWGKKSAAREE